MTFQLFNNPSDEELDRVEQSLRAIPDIKAKLLNGIARAVDEVVDPVRSARWAIDELDQPEKTVIGIRVENVLRMDLALERSNHLDMKVAGVNVDVKFTIKSNWTIPPEAVGEICLVTQFNEKQKTISAGLIRTTKDVLNLGKNRDQKTTISTAGKQYIRWLVKDEPATPSIVCFMANLDSEVRREITDPHVGAQVRQNRLFSALLDTPIPEQLVEAISQHKDWTRRLRPDARNPSAPGETIGYDVLRQSSAKDRARLAQEGKPPLEIGFCMSVLAN